MSRFIPNRQGVGQVMRSAEVSRALRKRADRIADEARRIARAEAYDTGAYHDSIHVVEDTSGDRARARVVADDPKASFIEYGTETVSKVRTLGRAADVKE